MRVGYLIWLLILLATAGSALAQGGQSAAPAPAYLDGTYLGWAQIKEQGQAGPGDKVALKPELQQQGDRLQGLITVGEAPADQIVFAISKGRVKGSDFWLEAEELIWRLRLTGDYADNRIKGKVRLANQDPAKKLLGPNKASKNFKPVTMQGTVEVTRR